MGKSKHKIFTRVVTDKYCMNLLYGGKWNETVSIFE
jgi:hypothetical protein